MPGQPWTPERDDHLKALHAAGKTLHAIHVETGWAKGSISGAAKRLGLAWDRARVESATRSRKAVCADLRARALERAYKRVHVLYDRLEADEFTTFVKGEYGSQDEQKLSWVPVDDEKTLAQAIGTHMATAKRIEDAEAASTDVGAVRSMLGRLGDALGLPASEPVGDLE